MKPNIKPTAHEKVMPDDAFIVTKTDSKGRITYANRLFLEISGYSEKELLNKQHNVVRHPDMPRGIFHLLWETLKSGEEFNALIKNLCKDGSFYWVMANITPSLSPKGELLGYYSVRRKPREDSLNAIQNLYTDMLAAEAKTNAKEAINVSTAILDARLNNLEMKYDKYVLTL